MKSIDLSFASGEIMSSGESLENFKLFCQFLGGEKRIPNALLWSFSIWGRATTGLSVLYKEVLEQIPKCSEEWKEFERKKYGGRTESLILALRYEIFLNFICSLCNNLGFVVYSLYRSKSLPQGFNEQRSRFLEDNSIDSAYSEILKDT